jgi:hypothetical protein
MARRLEDLLYRTASSAEEYDNFNTLKDRLQSLALSMGARAATKRASGPAQAISPSTQPAAQPAQAAQPPAAGGQPVAAKTDAPDGGKVLDTPLINNTQGMGNQPSVANNQAPQKPSGESESESSSYHSCFFQPSICSLCCPSPPPCFLLFAGAAGRVNMASTVMSGQYGMQMQPRGGSNERLTYPNSASANPLCEVFQFHDTIRSVSVGPFFLSFDRLKSNFAAGAGLVREKNKRPSRKRAWVF